jgi:hypothetical protein
VILEGIKIVKFYMQNDTGVYYTAAELKKALHYERYYKQEYQREIAFEDWLHDNILNNMFSEKGEISETALEDIDVDTLRIIEYRGEAYGYIFKDYEKISEIRKDGVLVAKIYND